MMCSPNPAHATLADQGCHLIGTDAGAGTNRHSSGFYVIRRDYDPRAIRR